MAEPPPPLDYASRTLRPKSRPIPFLMILLAMILAAAMIISLVPVSTHDDRNYGRVSCSSRMRQIGQGIVLYQNDFAGNYPNNLEDLTAEFITPALFVCPGSNDVASTQATTQAIGADFRAGGHLSYIYLGRGLTDKTVTADMVVLYEPLSHHTDGMNVLFGDGHAEWIDADLGKKLITAAASGRRVHLNVAAKSITISP